MSIQPISQDYCKMRSGGIERVQKLNERRIEDQGQRLDDLTGACIQLTGAVERMTCILERQEQRMDRMEKRDFFNFLESPGGKTLLRVVGIGFLLLLCSGLGINALKILEII